MPKKKKGDRAADDKKEAMDRLSRSIEYENSIMDSLTRKASESGFSQEEFANAVRQVRKILSDPHISGIKAVTPEFSVESVDRDAVVIKISISAARYSKAFSVRKRL